MDKGVIKMPYLKFYSSERDEFSDECKIFLSPSEVVKIVNKLVRHYKLPKLVVRFTKRYKNTGSYTRYTGFGSLKKYWMSEVNFHKSGSSLENVVHEVAHHYQSTKTGKTGHNKKLMSVIRRMIKYCGKMNHWGLKKHE